MATATQHDQAHPDDQPGARATASSKAAHRPRRWRRVALAIVVVMLVIVGLAPVIIAHSRLLNVALGWVASAAELNGRLTAGRASLGWFSPVALYDLKIDDPSGESLIEIPKLISEKSLAALLRSQGQIGTIRIERPNIEIALTADGSNLEDVLSAWLPPNESQASTSATVSLEVTEATAHIRDSVSGSMSTIDNLDVRFKSAGAEDGMPTCSVSGNVRHAKSTGHFALKLEDGQAADADAQRVGGSTGTPLLLSIRTENVPLEAAEPLWRRFDIPAELAGSLNTQLACRWSMDAHGFSDEQVNGTISVDNVSLAAQCLGPDRLRLASVQIPCQLRHEQGGWRIEKLAVHSELGHVSLTGLVPNMAGDSGQAARALLAALAETKGRLDAEVDLARLASSLPATVNLRQDTRLSSGLLRMRLESGLQNGKRTWDANLETDRLTAIHRGREIAWDHPLLVNVVAHKDQKGFAVDRLYCESDFLQLEGEGTREFFSLSASHDLARLRSELGRFVDLGDIKLAGQGATWLSWKNRADGTFEADVDLEIEGFELAGSGAEPWREDKLQIQAAGSGLFRGATPEKIQEARLLVLAGSDRLSMGLTAAIEKPGLESNFPIDVQLQGNLQRWKVRAQTWAPQLADCDLNGDAELLADATCGTKSVRVGQIQCVVRDFRCWAPGIHIDEPLLQANGSADLDVAASQLVVRDFAIDLSSATAKIPEARLQWPTGGLALSGRADVEGDIARLLAWTHDPQAAIRWRATGAYRAQATVEREGRVTKGRIDLAATDVVISPEGSQPLGEPKITVALQGSFDAAADKLEASELKLVSDAARVSGKGEIQELAGRRQAQFDGRVDYDLEKLQRVFQPYLGENIRIAGRESRAVSFSGPLRPAPDADSVLLERLTAHSGLTWQSAEVHGLPLGPGQFDAELQKGVLRISPFDLAVSDGHLRLAPQVRLAPGPAEAWQAPGRLIENVRITPEMCNAALMYAAPVLAGVTEAQGRISLDLENCRVPLADPASGSLAGKLIVHSVDITPTTLAQELAVMVQTISQLLTRSARAPRALSAVSLTRESEVPFELIDRRIYHRGLSLEFPDVTVETAGSVGLDQSLSMEALMPIPEKWIGNNSLGEALRGQVIRLPIGGTLAHPRLDRRELDRVAGRLIGDTAKGALRGELNRQLDKLFRAPSP